MLQRGNSEESVVCLSSESDGPEKSGRTFFCFLTVTDFGEAAGVENPHRACPGVVWFEDYSTTPIVSRLSPLSPPPAAKEARESCSERRFSFQTFPPPGQAQRGQTGTPKTVTASLFSMCRRTLPPDVPLLRAGHSSSERVPSDLQALAHRVSGEIPWGYRVRP